MLGLGGQDVRGDRKAALGAGDGLAQGLVLVTQLGKQALDLGIDLVLGDHQPFAHGHFVQHEALLEAHLGRGTEVGLVGLAGLADHLEVLVHLDAGALEVALHPAHGAIGLVVDGLGRIVDLDGLVDDCLEELVQVVGPGGVDCLCLQLLPDGGLEAGEGIVVADDQREVVVDGQELFFFDGVEVGDEGGLLAGELLVFVTGRIGQVKGLGLGSRHSDELFGKAGNGQGGLFSQDDFQALFLFDLFFAELGGQVEHHEVTHCGRPVDGDPLGMGILDLFEACLYLLVGDRLRLEGQPQDTVVAGIDLGHERQQDGHAEGVPLDIAQLAHLVRLVLDLLERFFVPFLAEILDRLLLDGGAPKGADHRGKGGMAAPVARHVELFGDLAGRLAQLHVNLGCFQLDDDIELAVFQPLGCYSHVYSIPLSSGR